MDILDLNDLTIDIKNATNFLDNIPIWREFTPEQIDIIDDIRYEAMKLSDIAKVTIEEFQGK